MWKEENSAITKDFSFSDFQEALSFVSKVAKLAQKANHHPDILIHGFNKVRLTLSTHSEGRVTEKDLALAKKIDAL